MESPEFEYTEKEKKQIKAAFNLLKRKKTMYVAFHQKRLDAIGIQISKEEIRLKRMREMYQKDLEAFNRLKTSPVLMFDSGFPNVIPAVVDIANIPNIPNPTTNEIPPGVQNVVGNVEK